MKFSTLISLAAAATTASASYINYTTVTGYFLQDDPSTNPSTFVYVCPLSSIASYPVTRTRTNKSR